MTKIEPLFKEDKNGFDELYAIYSSSFPRSEQKQKEELLQMLCSADYTIFTTKIDSKIVGFCAVFHSSKTSFFLIEYMAVKSELRGVGVGRELFLHVKKQMAKAYGAKPLLVEIDSPDKKSTEWEIREKRERFYRKLGCRIIEPLDYILPIKSEERAPQMKLLLHHDELANISNKLLKEWLESLYVLIYGCQKDDERIGEMLLGAPKILKLI